MQFTSNIKTSTKKQIVIANVSANTVMYTVPSGREFKGKVITSSTNGLSINGVPLTSSFFFGGNANTYFQGAIASGEITLVTGTYVTEGSSGGNTTIIGVEYDV